MAESSDGEQYWDRAWRVEYAAPRSTLCNQCSLTGRAAHTLVTQLSHQPPYRELPCEWVEDFLVGRGLQVEAVRSFDTFHTYEDLRAQWSVAWHEAGKVDELTKAANLSAALIAQLARLEEEAGQCAALREPGFAFGGEYAIVARPRREGRSAGGPSKCPAAIAALRHPPLSVDEFHRRMTAPTVGL